MAKPKTAKQTLAQLTKESPEVLEREVNFDALVMRIITIDPDRVVPAPKREKRKCSITKSSVQRT
jgi:hypothetical protein